MCSIISSDESAMSTDSSEDISFVSFSELRHSGSGQTVIAMVYPGI